MATLKDRGFGLLECENMRRAFGALAEKRKPMGQIDDERLRSRILGRLYFSLKLCCIPPKFEVVLDFPEFDVCEF